jgi:hypothetical protein
MVELNGEEAPRLFNKWKPVKFIDCSLDKNGRPFPEHNGDISLYYNFPDGWVQFDMNSDQCYIQGNFFVNGHSHGPRYPAHLLEMYLDAKKYAAGIISVLRKELPEKIVDDISTFGRFVNIAIEVKDGPGGIPSEDTSNRLSETMRIYASIEEQLRKEHCFSEKQLQTAYAFDYFPVGEGKLISSPKGIHLLTEQFGDSFMNAGTLYLKLVGDESAKEEDHKAALDTLVRVIEGNGDILADYFGNHFRDTNGNGTRWEVDFRRLPFYRQLSSGIASRLLPSGSNLK